MKPAHVKQFHRDLKAAVAAGAPVELASPQSSVRLGLLTQRKLDDLENQTLQWLDGLTAAERELVSLVKALPVDLPDRYRAALQVFARTNSMSLVLDGLTARSLVRQKVSRATQWGIVYLLLIMGVSASGLYLFATHVTPVVKAFRADLALAAAINAPPRWDFSGWLIPVAWGIVAAAVLLVLWLLLDRRKNISVWLGGMRAVRLIATAMAFRILRALIATGLPVGEAAELACQLASTDSQGRRRIEVLIQQDGTIPQEHLRVVESDMMVSAHRQISYLTSAVPAIMVCVFGGAVAIVYCLVIFWPVLALIKDLPTLGT